MPKAGEPVNSPIPPSGAEDGDAEDGADVPAGDVVLVALDMLVLDPGMGGKDSRSEAPKDEEGLKALSPLNPVIWGLSAGDSEMEGVPPLAVVVAPVGWLDNEENTESENPVPDAVVPVTAVSCALRNGNVPIEPALFREKDDATLAILALLFASLLLKAPNSCSPPSEAVCCGFCCWAVWLLRLPPFKYSSINVGALGTGGAGATGTPKGLREPV